ncbi:Fibroblast growth factor 19 [Merluccius polli]|uniref:Fibroblast growth factor n=1 Tax=Merluccius polli TaxID=89951 RepID=A0AA47MAW7_MERPO|nr:Fibroblast growth factor 19 [Merluccius polli]
MSLVVFAVVSFAHVLFTAGVVCMPLSDQGPHLDNGWGQVVRLRHLYAARHGLHLLISGDGKVHGSTDQTANSLMEIRPVDRGCVVIKGIAAAQFLCAVRNGRLYSSLTYIRDDCTFREQILPDGYNIYVSDKHNTLVSLGGHRQGQPSRERNMPAHAQFLPMISALGLGTESGLEPRNQPEQELVDNMDPFSMVSQNIHSPSFQRR